MEEGKGRGGKSLSHLLLDTATYMTIDWSGGGPRLVEVRNPCGNINSNSPEGGICVPASAAANQFSQVYAASTARITCTTVGTSHELESVMFFRGGVWRGEIVYVGHAKLGYGSCVSVETILGTFRRGSRLEWRARGIPPAAMPPFMSEHAVFLVQVYVMGGGS